MAGSSRHRLFSFLALCLLLLQLLAAVRGTRGVLLPYGDVEGAPCAEDARVTEYLGVPFAMAPLRRLRFRSPIAFHGRFPGGKLLATRPPPACPQFRRFDKDMVMSEDCLFLNIWAPSNLTLGNLPVRVFIHGGAWAGCSASLPPFSGCYSTASTQTILVNVQYRLNVLGFLAHPGTYSESKSTGNWGIQDQQLALQWVQRHIAAFGGDPSRVVISGQSAGAWAVALHMSLPSSAGLFSAAISESVPGWDFATSEEAYVNTWKVMAALGCPRDAYAEVQLACLRNAGLDRLMGAMPRFNLLYLSEPQNQLFAPVVDGTFIESQILETLKSGNVNKVPYLIGSNKDEGLFMVGGAFTDLNSLSVNDIIQFIATVYPSANYSRVLEAYPESDYAAYEAPSYRRLAHMWTDIYMTCPLDRAVRMLSMQKVPIYRYWMTHVPSCPYRDLGLGSGGVAHDDQIFFVFNNTKSSFPSRQCTFTKDEQDLANQIVFAWAAMARDGHPSVLDGIVPWPTWDPMRQQTMILDMPLQSSKLDFQQRCSVFRQEAVFLADGISSHNSETHPTKEVA